MKEAAKVVQEGGKIITIVTSLLAAFTGLYTSYAGSKAPVEHFTRGVAKELSGRRISVNAIGPGPMDTRKPSRCSVRTCCRSSLTLVRSILLPSRIRRRCCVPQVHGDGGSADGGCGYCAHCDFFVYFGTLDHWADYLCKWRIHNKIGDRKEVIYSWRRESMEHVFEQNLFDLLNNTSWS